MLARQQLENDFSKCIRAAAAAVAAAAGGLPVALLRGVRAVAGERVDAVTAHARVLHLITEHVTHSIPFPQFARNGRAKNGPLQTSNKAERGSPHCNWTIRSNYLFTTFPGSFSVGFFAPLVKMQASLLDI